MDVCAALEAYYIQDKFVPVNLLKMDDKLKDAEGVFGEVRHGKYLGTDVAVKRSKPEVKKERPEVYKAFLNEARILGYVQVWAWLPQARTDYHSGSWATTRTS